MLIELALVSLSCLQEAVPEDLLTVAESSDYSATATSDQVEQLIGRLAERSDRLHVMELARSTEGRSVPLLILADPPVRTPREAQASGKPIVLLFGNIHAGEVCGKEALLQLTREIVLHPEHPLLASFVLLVVPNYNPDGNDKMDKGNRPGQVGPANGMGQRPNGQGLDLNRDWIKLEAPETRGFVRALNEWAPHLVVDTHTTNGSHHRYTLTYAAPNNPSGYAPAIAFVRDELLPTVTDRLQERTEFHTFYYGNFDRSMKTWSTYSADPRFGCPYRGLRGQLSILSEAYSYASYEDRIVCTREFLREILHYAEEHKERMLELHRDARAETTAAGTNPQPNDIVGLRHSLAAYPQPTEILGWKMEQVEGRRRAQPTGDPEDYTVLHRGRFEPTVAVSRPYAYLLEPGLERIVERLELHGAQVEPFAGSARVETYRITKLDRAEREFQGHRMLSLEVEAARGKVELGADATLVRLAQPLGNLIVYLLEPQSTDGLAAWNFLDDKLELGGSFPIHRVSRPEDLD